MIIITYIVETFSDPELLVSDFEIIFVNSCLRTRKRREKLNIRGIFSSSGPKKLHLTHVILVYESFYS